MFNTNMQVKGWKCGSHDKRENMVYTMTRSPLPLRGEEEDLLNGFGTLHPDVPVFECSKCKLLFSQIRRLKQHSCLGVLNEPGRQLRRKRRLVQVRGMTPEEEAEEAEGNSLNQAKQKRRRKPRLESLSAEDDHTADGEESLNSCPCEEIKDNCRNETKVNKEEAAADIPRCGEGSEDTRVSPQLNDVSNTRDEEEAIQTEQEKKLTEHQVPRKRHRKKTNPINLVCSVCGKQCRKPYELRLHMRGHENDRPFECGVCRKRFVSKCYLNKHTRDVHDASHLKCKECCIGFESKEQLREHCENHSHHIQWPYQCSHCDKSFPKRSVLVAHQRQHEGKRHFKCTHCTAAFFSKSALDQHSWLHTERPFACEQCSSRFLTKHLLNMHMMDHTGQRPYLCDTCGQRFKTKAQLQHHSEVHADGLPFVCEVCGKNFKWKNNLVKHVRKHAAATRGEEELPFVCSICRKSYANKQSLNYHAMTHTGERPFACSHCSKSFRGAGHLRKHVKHMHRNDPAQSVSNATASEPEIQAPEIQSPEIQAPVLHVMPAAYSAGGEGPRRPSELTGCCTVDASLLGLAPLLTLDVASNMPSDQNHILYPFNTISPHNL